MVVKIVGLPAGLELMFRSTPVSFISSYGREGAEFRSAAQVQVGAVQCTCKVEECGARADQERRENVIADVRSGREECNGRRTE